MNDDEPRPDDDWTLGDAKQWLRDQLRDGAACPCCTQFARIYPRTITSTSVRGLIAIYHAGGHRDYVHIPTAMGRKQADECKLVHWGLIEEQHTIRPDGSRRAGYWRITPKGRDWLLGHITVPKYAHIYDGRLLGLDGPPITVTDALGTRFSYDELMGRAS